MTTATQLLPAELTAPETEGQRRNNPRPEPEQLLTVLRSVADGTPTGMDERTRSRVWFWLASRRYVRAISGGKWSYGQYALTDKGATLLGILTRWQAAQEPEVEPCRALVVYTPPASAIVTRDHWWQAFAPVRNLVIATAAPEPVIEFSLCGPVVF